MYKIGYLIALTVFDKKNIYIGCSDEVHVVLDQHVLTFDDANSKITKTTKTAMRSLLLKNGSYLIFGLVSI